MAWGEFVFEVFIVLFVWSVLVLRMLRVQHCYSSRIFGI